MKKNGQICAHGVPTIERDQIRQKGGSTRAKSSRGAAGQNGLAAGKKTQEKRNPEEVQVMERVGKGKKVENRGYLIGIRHARNCLLMEASKRYSNW